MNGDNVCKLTHDYDAYYTNDLLNHYMEVKDKILEFTLTPEQAEHLKSVLDYCANVDLSGYKPDCEGTLDDEYFGIMFRSEYKLDDPMGWYWYIYYSTFIIGYLKPIFEKRGLRVVESLANSSQETYDIEITFDPLM